MEYPDHAGVSQLIADLNSVYRETPPLWEWDNNPEGFRWIDANDSNSNVFSFLRYGGFGNLGGVDAHLDEWHGLPASTTLTLPPLGTLWLRHVPG